MAIKAVLFDLDGTLVDSNERHVDAWAQAFSEAGYAFPRAALHAQIGKGGDNYLPALLPDSGAAERQRLDTRHGELFKADHLPHVRPFPGAHDLLAAMKRRGIAVALASSAGGDEVDHYVDLLDAADLVSTRTSKDDAEHSKPDPDIFQAALKAAGVGAHEAIVVGDTPWDVIAANAAGVPTVAVLSGGFPEDALRGAGAIALYRDVADLLAHIDESPLG